MQRKLHAAKIVGVRVLEEAGLQSVYNLEVEEANCYYVEGVLVHNCDAVQYISLYAKGGAAKRASSGEKDASPHRFLWA
jgi:hypothetical protein